MGKGRGNLQQKIVSAFQTQLIDLGDWRANLEGLSFCSLNDQEAAVLEEPFSEEEIVGALKDLNGEKAPGHDGFTGAFWQFSWDFVKGEVLEEFKDFYETSRFVRSLNSNFIVWVPKKMGAEDFKDFRPVSLVGSLYKLIAKALANRLKKIMGRLVNKAQNAFVEGRQILDAPLIANEVIDSMLRKGKKYPLQIGHRKSLQPDQLEFSTYDSPKNGVW